jgi:hypothetical protein
MARLYAQLMTVLFVVVGFGGLFLGDAGHISSGHAGGNLGDVTLHLTWARDALDIALLVVFAYVGFMADRHTGRLLVLAAGALLLLLGIAGFVIGDDDLASKGAAGMNFPVVVNVFDLAVGALAVLCGLGTLEDEPA